PRACFGRPRRFTSRSSRPSPPAASPSRRRSRAPCTIWLPSNPRSRAGRFSRSTGPKASPRRFACERCPIARLRASLTGARMSPPHPQLLPMADSFKVPTPGARIERTYLVERTLGQGAMGAVLLARDEALDRRVAIKFVRPEAGVDDRVRERVRFEAQLMAKVRHENVAGVYSYGELDGAPYFVMEYIDGEDLDTTLARLNGDVLPRREGLRMLGAICAGIHAIHEAG